MLASTFVTSLAVQVSINIGESFNLGDASDINPIRDQAEQLATIIANVFAAVCLLERVVRGLIGCRLPARGLSSLVSTHI